MKESRGSLSASGIYGLRLLGEPRLQRLGLLVLVSLVLAVRAIQFAAWTSQVQWGYDFSFYWTAAQHLVHGEPIYSAQQLAGPYAPQGQEGFLYPPPFAAVLAPLAVVLPADPRLVNWLWFAVGLAALVVSVLAVARSERMDDRFELVRGRGRWWLVAAALAFPPVVAELVLGNVHLELLALFSLAWLGLRRGTQRGDIVAGAAIGAAALIKVFPGLLLVWLLLTRRFRAAGSVLGSILVLTALTLPIAGLQAWREYPTVLANLGPPAATADTLAPIVWLMPSIGFDTARGLVTVIGLGLVALVAVLVQPAPGPEADRRVGPTAREAASFGAAVTVSVLIAPALYQHYLAILVLPLLLGLAAGVRLRWLALAYLLMWGGQQPALGDLAWVVNRAFPTLGALALLAALVAAAVSWARPLQPPLLTAADH